MKPTVEFPDAVLVVITHIRAKMPAGTKVYSRVPSPTPAEFIRVERLGGIRRNLFLDRPRVDIECWSDSEEGAEALCSKVRAHVLAMAGAHGDTTVYDVAEVSGPQWLPDSATSKPRYAFAVEFSTRGRKMS